MSIKIPDFNNTKYAFQYKDNKALANTKFVFGLFNYPWLVKILTTSADLVLKYRLPGKAIIKQTVFKVFCAGENLDQAFNTIRLLSKYHVKAVLDYVSESESSDAGYAENTKRIKANVINLSKEFPGHYVSIKLAGLENYHFLKKLSEPNYQKTNEEETRFNQLMSRVDEICAAAFEHNICIYFDAEERCTQDIYDYIVERMMEKYNKQKAVIYNTLQMYLTDRVAYLERVIKESKEKQYYAGIKIVRGAYLEKENKRAADAGKVSPVFQTKPGTDKSFDTAIDLCLANISHVYLCIASHNENSIMHAIKEVNRLNIIDGKQKVSFSQLLGMSDNLTFNLAEAGLEVSKYLPYGEVEKAIPYLIRRADENKSVDGQMGRELRLLTSEIKRRKSNA
ncbi:MAG: proline dehydrogenase family protein [Bacteroidia bacterium]|nr:proline dehydrogenase family protein [Bacteroidia bacterium]